MEQIAARNEFSGRVHSGKKVPRWGKHKKFEEKTDEIDSEVHSPSNWPERTRKHFWETVNQNFESKWAFGRSWKQTVKGVGIRRKNNRWSQISVFNREGSVDLLPP